MVLLRILCLQQWFGLSDLWAEQALFTMTIYRDFAGLGDADRINDPLSAQDLMFKAGSVVDSTFIAAPRSTKKDRETCQCEELPAEILISRESSR